ncbi:uncharacterized protein [Antedon mediterranea]|uniref:uncharacterized protein n=1 Tax=Antedon mediterranea TaxID=105859 RepID=UPI003AF7812D
MEENLMQYMSIHSPNKKTLSKLLDRSAGDSRSSFSDVLMDGAAGMIDSALTKGKNRRKPIKDKVSFTTQKSILKTSKATDENIFSELVWSGNRLERVQMPSEQQNFFDDEAFDVYAERTAAAPDQPNILEAVAKEHLEKLLKEEEEGTPAPETDDSDLSLDDKFTKNNNNPEIADPVINEAVETSKKSETMSFVEEVSSNILKDVTDNFLIESDANNLRQSGIDKSEIPNTPSIEIKVDITNRVNASLEDICQDRTSPPVEGSNENNLEEQITSTNKESNDLNGNKTESITLVSTKSENNFQNIITGDTILSPEQSIKCNRNDLKATEELKSNIRELVIDGSTTNNNNEIKDSNLVENFNNGIEDSNSMENPNNETKDSNLVEDPNNKINDSNLVENFNNGFEDSNFINNSNNEIKDSNSVDNSNNESAHYSNESSFENSNVQMTGLILEDSKTSNSVFIPSKTETSIPLKESDMVDEEVRDKNDNIYECLPEVKYEKSLDTFQSNEFQEQSSSNNNNVHFKAVNQNNDKTSPNSVKGSNRHHVKNVQFVIPESTEHKVGVPCANKGTLLDELSGENCNSEASDIPTDSNTFSADLFTKDVGKISDSVNQNNEDELEEDDEEKEEAVYAGDKDDGKEDDKNDDDSPGSSGGSGLQEPGNSSNDHNGGNDSNSPGGTDSQTPDSGTDDCQRPNGGTDGSQRPDGGTQEHNGNPNHDYSDQSNWSSQQSDTTKQTSSSEPVNESDEKFIGTLSTQDIMSDVDIEYDDIPEIDDSVLFCGICGLDEDTCVCPSSKISKDFQSCSRIDSGYSGSNTSRSQKSLEVMASAKECWSPREDLQMTDVANDLVMMYRNQYNNNVTSREDMSFGNIVDGHFHNENLKNVLGKSQIVQQTNHHSLLDNVGNCNESKETSLSANTELEDSISHDLQVNVNNLCTSLNGGDEPNTLSVVASSKQLSKPRSKVEEAPLVAPIPPVSFRINARPPPGHVYYFSYGENMNKNRVSLYIGRKDVQRLWGLLFGFQIKFNKKGSDSEAGVFANIEANPESSVEGCVYLITKEELKTLDKFIGYPQFFSRVTFPVWMINSNDPDALGIAQYCIPAVMYIATDKWTTTDMTLTSEYSVQQCLRGSELLTPSYVEHIAGCAKS